MLYINHLSFKYSEKQILKDINFTISKGQICALIGESGCGKSTLLKLIYGLLDADNGTIFWNETRILGPKYNLVPGMDFIKYLAQDFDLMPYVTVAENVGKYLSNFYPEEKQQRITELLTVVDMLEFANQPTKNLSGGQMQRVALAKALAVEPEILLLDEPFSHIDNFRKNKLRRTLFEYIKQKKITCMVATHDVNDILAFADETIVIKNGKIIAQDTTKNIYQQADNQYIASLFDEVNIIQTKFLSIENTSQKYQICYPQQLKKVTQSNLKGTIKKSYFKGKYYLIEASYEDGILFFEHPTELPPTEIVWLAMC
jgi:ABC-type sulfate/molybdate transport systems ATPase subunit